MMHLAAGLEGGEYERYINEGNPYSGLKQIAPNNVASLRLAWNTTIKRDTWPGNSWQHGGAAVWSGVSIDPKDG